MADTALVIDKEEPLRRALGEALERAGFEVHREPGLEGGRVAAAGLLPAVVLVDAALLEGGGAEAVGELRAGGAAVVALAGPRDLDTAARAVQLGAEAFVPKGADVSHVVATALRAAEKARLLRQVAHLRGRDRAGDLDALGASPAMRRLAEQARRIAANDRQPLLITGEAGTGKAWLARLAHALSPRAAAPFVELRGAGLGAAAVRAILFGQERGASAERGERQIGLLELADRGTLFIDELTDLPLELQAVLVGVLDGGRFQRAGGTRDVSVDVRIVAATSRDLVAEIHAGRMRDDLVYRLSQASIHLPPLRERSREDRLALIVRLVAELHRDVPGSPATCSAEAIERLAPALWPGNVRELRNVIERALLAARGAAEIRAEHLPGELRVRGAMGDRRAFQPVPLAQLERDHIERALRHFAGNRTRTARALGISRATLINKIRTYGLTL